MENEEIKLPEGMPPIPGSNVGDDKQGDVGDENHADVGEGADATGDIEARIAEAEERGYLRGRNERIEELMKEPGSAGETPTLQPGDELAEVLILNNLRPSVWE